jgi:hypothetical protein
MTQPSAVLSFPATLAVQDDNDDNGSAGVGQQSQSAAPEDTPHSWRRALRALPVVDFDANLKRQLTKLAALHPSLPHRRILTRTGEGPLVAVFRNLLNTAWLVVTLDPAGVSGKLITEETIDFEVGPSVTMVRYYSEYFVDGLGGVKFSDSPTSESASDPHESARQLAIYFATAFGWVGFLSDRYCTLGASYEEAAQLSRDVADTLVEATQRSEALQLAFDRLTPDELADVFAAALSVAESFLPYTFTVGGSDLLPVEELRKIFSPNTQKYALAALFIVLLYDTPFVFANALDPLEWPDDHLTPAAKDLMRSNVLRTGASSVANLLRTIYMKMVPLRSVLRADYVIALRVLPTGVSDSVSSSSSSSSSSPVKLAPLLDVEREQFTGVLVLTPGVVTLYQHVRYGDNRLIERFYELTSADFARHQLQYADRYDAEPRIEPAAQAQRVDVADGDWSSMYANELSVRAVYSGLGLLAPLGITLRATLSVAERTDRSLYIIGLLAVARWLADIERTQRDGAHVSDELNAARLQIAGYDDNERRMIEDAKKCLFA